MTKDVFRARKTILRVITQVGGGEGGCSRHLSLHATLGMQLPSSLSSPIPTPFTFGFPPVLPPNYLTGFVEQPFSTNKHFLAAGSGIF